MKAARALAAFEKLSYSHQREHVQWVEEAKHPETRQRRIASVVERVTQTVVARARR